MAESAAADASSYDVGSPASVKNIPGCDSLLLGNMSLRMEDAENRLITEPAPIGSDRLEGQRCKYAEKSYMYKYDLGHVF
mgnify:CR=1 FL=1